MMTEDEARGKWCPMARLATTAGTYNRCGPKAALECIASGCAMWRWGMTWDRSTEYGMGGAVNVRLCRREGEPKRGYCGLAGKPEVG